MGENLFTNASDVGTVGMESFWSLLKGLSESRDFELSSSGDLILEPKRLLEDFSCNLRVLSEDTNVEALEETDLETYIEQLNKYYKSIEEDNMKVSEEIDALETQVSSDLTKLYSDVDSMLALLNFSDFKCMFSVQSGIPTRRPSPGGVLGEQRQAFNDHKFKVLELSQQSETCRRKLTALENLDHALKRIETIYSLEELFCGVKCAQFKDSSIKFSLRTPIPSIDSSNPRQTLNFSLEPSYLDHEVLIELTEKMELKNVEISPSDVHLNGIINAVKFSRFLPISAVENILGWLLRQIQQRIILSNFRHLLVKDASNSRRSVVYSDPEETITATYLEDGIVASIKMSQLWPLSGHPLMLRSLKQSGSHSKSIPWNSLCNVQGKANSLNIQTRRELIQLLDFIEENAKGGEQQVFLR